MYRKRLRKERCCACFRNLFVSLPIFVNQSLIKLETKNIMKTFQLQIPDSYYSITDSMRIKWLLWKHKWFVLGENGYEELLTFQRDSTLVVFSNKKEERGSWGYNNKASSLVIRGIKEKINRTLRPFFWDGCLLVFKLNGVDEYFFLVNAEKAGKLNVSPLESFEAYANDSIEKQKSNKRRIPVDEKMNQAKAQKLLEPEDEKWSQTEPSTKPAAEDPAELIANYPGPVAQDVKPVGYTEAPLPAVVPLAEVEERIQQALEEQQKMLEKKWLQKLDEEKEKCNAAVWVERNETDKIVQKALKKQAITLHTEAREALAEQKRQLRREDMEIRNQRMQKIKLEVAELKNTMKIELECNTLKEKENIQSQIEEALKEQKKIFELRQYASRLKIEALETELEIVRSQQDEEDPESEDDGVGLDELLDMLHRLFVLCKTQNDGMLLLSRAILAEKKEFCAELAAQKLLFYKELKKERKKTREFKFHQKDVPPRRF